MKRVSIGVAALATVALVAAASAQQAVQSAAAPVRSGSVTSMPRSSSTQNAMQNTMMVDNGMKLGLSLGANVPMGDLGDGVKLGYGISGLLAFQPAALPFGLRAEVGYDRFAVDVPDELKDFYDDVSVVKGLLNAVVKFPGEGLSPYVMGGIGIFRSSGGGSGSTADQRSLGTVRRSNESSTDFGFDLGGGINFQLSGFASFLEATYTSVRGDGDSSEYIPVRFGVMFPIGGGGTTTGGNK